MAADPRTRPQVDEDYEDDMGDVHQEAPMPIIDLVMDGKASEAKDAIYSALYQKVGERIDAIRPEVRASINVPTATADQPSTEKQE